MTALPKLSKAQRRVLDEIGCGNHSPLAAKATISALLRDGLIVELPPMRVPFMGSICMEVRQFDMPTLVHMAWCDLCSAECDEEALS